MEVKRYKYLRLFIVRMPVGRKPCLLAYNGFSKGFTLPLTGGMGTMPIVIIGAVIICLAVVVAGRSKKRKAA